MPLNRRSFGASSRRFTDAARADAEQYAGGWDGCLSGGAESVFLPYRAGPAHAAAACPVRQASISAVQDEPGRFPHRGAQLLRSNDLSVAGTFVLPNKSLQRMRGPAW